MPISAITENKLTNENNYKENINAHSFHAIFSKT